MPLVNLIQEQRNAIRQRERQTRMVLMAIVGIGAVSFLTAGYFTFETVKYNLKSGELRAQKERLAPMMTDLDNKNLEIGSLQLRRDTLTGAEKDTARWSSLLTYLGSNTPDGVVLSDFRSDMSPDPGTPTGLTMIGLSIDQQQVGDFILRLESSPEMTGVTLKYTQERVGPSNKSTQFELSAGMEGSATKDPNAVDATEAG